MGSEILFALTAKDRDRVSRAVKIVEDIPSISGRAAGQTRLFAGETLGGVNVSGRALPFMGLIWAFELDSNTLLYNCKLPEFPGVSRFGILTGACAIDSECSFLIEGIGTVLLNPDQADDVVEGTFVGLSAGSYLAVPSNVAWMMVLKKFTTGTPRAIVEIRRDGKVY